MKIAFIGDAGHVNLSGWATYIAKQFKHEVHILSFNRPKADLPDVHIHLIDSKKRKNSDKYNYFTKIGKTRRLLNDINPALTIGYRLTSFGFMAVMAKVRPVIVIGQGTDIFTPRPLDFKSMVVKYVLNKAEAIHIWSDPMQHTLELYGIHRNKFINIPKGIDTTVFHHRDEPKISKDIVLISTRQLRQSYNHQVAIGAMAKIHHKYKNVRYNICGDGEYKPQLEKLISENQLEQQIRLLGKLDAIRLSSELRRAHIYISFQSTDGVSASLLEAMGCGCFPVVTDNPANRLWIRDGHNGFLVDQDDPDEIAQKICSAIENDALRQEAIRTNDELIAAGASMYDNTRRILSEYQKIVSAAG